MFLAASNFFEVLKLYGPLPDELEEKIKYSKWKAADLLKREQTLPTLSGSFPPEMTKSAAEIHDSLQIPDHLPADYKPSTVDADPKLLDQAEKYSRQAISAIQFEDVKAAIGCLEKALRTLKSIKN